MASARSRLETWLARVARERDVSPCVIVWDGGERGSRARSVAPLEVIYTARGTEADDRLRQLMRDRFADRASTTWVVSSDRAVKRSARDLGFVPLGAMTFWKRWADEPGRRKGRRNPVSGAPEPSEKPRPTKAGVEDLLAEMLGEKTEGDGDR